jgi:hypothetical protein
MSLPRYQIIVRDKGGNELGEFTEWRSLRFSDKVNDYGSCQFEVPVTSSELESLVSMRRYETVIKKNGQVVWAGEQSNRFGNLEANSPNWITIISHTYFEMLNSMYTSPFIRYEQVDQGEILKELVDDFQAKTGGDLGFTFGDYITGVLRDREYSNQNIMDAFVNMSNVINGPDFYITDDKQINIIPRRGIDRSKHTVLEWGINIERVFIDENFSNPCNEAIILGAGFGSEQAVVSYLDSGARGIYGLRQQRSSEIDVSSVDTLNARAEALVRKFKQPLVTIDIRQLAGTRPSFGSVRLGDIIRVKVREGIYNINDRYRIYGYEVFINQNRKEEISYILAKI